MFCIVFSWFPTDEDFYQEPFSKKMLTLRKSLLLMPYVYKLIDICLLTTVNIKQTESTFVDKPMLAAGYYSNIKKMICHAVFSKV